MEFTIEISSPIDRENLVAEIWRGDELIAELNFENEQIELEIYVKEGFKLSLNCDLFLSTLIAAKAKLLGTATAGTPLSNTKQTDH
jgi:hypothetical protein